MSSFNYQSGQLFAEDVSVAEIGQRFHTPCYIYSRAALERNWNQFNQAFGDLPHLICYSVKANSNLAVLNLLARLGSGFDVVSGGELERVIAANGKANQCVFSGVGKQDHEIRQALDAGIYCFNIESVAELTRINSIAAETNRKAPISVRLNPDVDPKTHPYIATGMKEHKFGIDMEQAIEIYQQAQHMQYIKVIGVDCHIGSQLTELTPIREALLTLLKLIDSLADLGIKMGHINIGGGLGVKYQDEHPPSATEYVEMLSDTLKGRQLKVIIEPGRSIAANAGILLTQVQYIKRHQHKHFAIVDAAMNDLLRPALYQAWHDIMPVQPHESGQAQPYDIVGGVCESGDFLGKDRSLILKEGDLLAIKSAGAYGFTMSSNYNSRPRAAEVMVDGDQTYLIRRRESVTQLYAGEMLIPDDLTDSTD